MENWGTEKKRFACPTASPEETQETNFFTFRRNRMKAGKSCFGGGAFRAAFRGVAFAMYPRFRGSHKIDLGHQSSQKWTSKTSCISSPSAPPRKHKKQRSATVWGGSFWKLASDAFWDTFLRRFWNLVSATYLGFLGSPPGQD